MSRYYFDLRDGGELVTDEEGIVLGNLGAVREEAVLALADLARETLQNFDGAQKPPAVRRSARPARARDEC